MNEKFYNEIKNILKENIDYVIPKNFYLKNIDNLEYQLERKEEELENLMQEKEEMQEELKYYKDTLQELLAR